MDLAKKINRRLVHPIMILGLICFFFFLPFLFFPRQLTNRGNDLSEEFLPLFEYFKESIVNYHELPLWQRIVLSGSPILGDAQNPWIYPPYWLVIFFPLDHFAIFILFFQFYISGVVMYILLCEFRLNKMAALAGAIAYMLSPKFTSHLEAGHVGMIVAFSLAPLFFLATKKIVASKNLLWPMTLGFTAAFMFVTYFTIFYYALLAATVFFTYNCIRGKPAITLLKNASLSLIFFVGACLPQILAGIEFFPLTNRENLSFFDIAQPLWSWKKIIIAILFPFVRGYNTFQTEEVLFLGIIPMLSGIAGFYYLPRNRKIFVLAGILLSVLITINVKSPFYSLFYYLIPGVRYLRITSRVWYLVTLIFSFLSAYFIDWLIKNKISLKFIRVLIICLVAELSLYGYIRISKPIQTAILANEVKEKLSQGTDYFRVYCTTACIPLGKGAPKGKGNAGGYNPVHLTYYDQFLSRAGGYTFTGFAPILPPYQTFSDKPQPNSYLLGLLGTRYVLSPYSLSDTGFVEEGQYANLILYRNLAEKPRVYWQDSQGNSKKLQAIFKPNSISVKTLGLWGGEIVVNEIYFPAWKATNDKGEKIPLIKKDDIILHLPVNGQSSSISINYQPHGLFAAFAAMLGTYLVMIFYLLRKLQDKLC